MLKQHSQLMITLLVIADALAVSGAWLSSYWLRFTFLPAPKGTPAIDDKYLPMLPLVVLAQIVVFYRLRLYRPRRSDRAWKETRDVIKALVVGVVVVVLIDYALPQSHKISRQFIATYAVIGTVLFAVFRLSVRALLHHLRRHGWNRRRAIIVGAGRTAQRLQQALQRNAWTGIEVIGFVDDLHRDRPLRGVPVRGPLTRLAEIVDSDPVDAVFIALPSKQASRLPEVLAQLETSMADVRIVPEINPAYALRPNVSQLDGVPIVSLRQTPLYGWNAILKRVFDVVVGSICLLVAMVPMLIIASLVRWTSRGPVFYRQLRAGLDGREFTMLKFRTMYVDAEKDGPVWSQEGRNRCTPIGTFLRRTSLDELPNLFNVLRGHMSLVGPRPERPPFIAQFKHQIPRYMLRHKMKAGMTGYAQVRGWRGDTSLHKRIQHDLYYIRNWSLWLDVRIMAATIASVWFRRQDSARRLRGAGLMSAGVPTPPGDAADRTATDSSTV